VVTVSDLMAATELTRSTVIAVCEDLLTHGWIRELENQRAAGDYRRGRPARRFTLDASAGCVLGIDVNSRRATAMVADLRGTIRGRASQPLPERELDSQERLDTIAQTVMSALEIADIARGAIRATTVGLPSSVERNGNAHTNDRSRRLDDTLKEEVEKLVGTRVELENNANLAALAERWCGSAIGVDNATILLAGDDLSAGIVASGRLLHRGTPAPSMAYLKLVDGVGSTEGLAPVATLWAMKAIAEGRDTQLRAAYEAGEAITAGHILAAAARGDEMAVDIANRLAERLARVIFTLASVLHPDIVVIAGAGAELAQRLLEPTACKLSVHMAAPPRIAASPLGDEIVSIGAVRHALDGFEARFLAFTLGSM
jgi:predicted NBD/HSP70 family sugar kinase